MSDPFLEKLATLVERLYYSTLSGKIDWVLDEDGESVLAPIGETLVSISYKHYKIDGDTTVDVQFKIFDKRGRVTTSVTDSDLAGMSVTVPGKPGWYTVMNETFQAARRIASGEEKILDDLIDILKSR